VVASEVRALAERSQTAAVEISGIAGDSVAITTQAGELQQKLVPDIQKTAELVQEISAASNEQSSRTKQINMAIQQLDDVIQQNASSSEEIAATAEELSSQATYLNDSIAFFKTRELSSRSKTAEMRETMEKVVRKTKTANAVSGAKSSPPSPLTSGSKALGVEHEDDESGRELTETGDRYDDEFEKF
jgi:methyl-accepting chemotaxis protein